MARSSGGLAAVPPVFPFHRRREHWALVSHPWRQLDFSGIQCLSTKACTATVGCSLRSPSLLCYSLECRASTEVPGRNRLMSGRRDSTIWCASLRGSPLTHLGQCGRCGKYLACTETDTVLPSSQRAVNQSQGTGPPSVTTGQPRPMPATIQASLSLRGWQQVGKDDKDAPEITTAGCSCPHAVRAEAREIIMLVNLIARLLACLLACFCALSWTARGRPTSWPVS